MIMFIGHLLIRIGLTGLSLYSSTLVALDFSCNAAIRLSKIWGESEFSRTFSLSLEVGGLDRTSNDGFGIGLNAGTQRIDISRFKISKDSVIDTENPFLNADNETMYLRQYGLISTYYAGSMTYSAIIGKGGYFGPGVETAHDHRFFRALIGYSILHPSLNPIDLIYNKNRSSPVNGRLEFNASLEAGSSQSRPCVTTQECRLNPKLQDHLSYLTFQLGLGWIVHSSGL